MVRLIAGDTGSALPPDVARMRDLLQLHGCLELAERIQRVSACAQAEGLDAWARPVTYPLAFAGSSTSATYEATIKERAALAVVSISRPAAGAMVQALARNGTDLVQSELLADHFLDDETAADPVPWVAPVVVGGSGLLRLKATGTGLTSSALVARGYHVSAPMAAALRAAGELCAMGINKAFAAAVTMTDLIQRPITVGIDVERLVATETLTGDAARVSLSLKVHQHELLPNGGAVILPLSVRKPGAVVFIPLRKNDNVQFEPKYSSAGGAGTGTLRTSWLGRRVY